ncbi:MAG: hypothetical protein GY822_32765 [Deltaproteobacteria bacterium]|nr:hypothetical protein [Deltaproteobacteria bacterium]
MTSTNAPFCSASLSQAEIARFHHIDHRRLLRLLSFVALYLLAAWASSVVFVQLETLLTSTFFAMLCATPLHILAGASLHAVSLLAHEGLHGVHGLLAPNAVLNRVISACCAAPVGQHNLYPGIPWYHLEAAHQVLRPTLVAEGAPLIASYAAFVHEFVVATFKRRPVGTVTPRTLARGE